MSENIFGLEGPWSRDQCIAQKPQVVNHISINVVFNVQTLNIQEETTNFASEVAMVSEELKINAQDLFCPSCHTPSSNKHIRSNDKRFDQVEKMELFLDKSPNNFENFLINQEESHLKSLVAKLLPKYFSSKLEKVRFRKYISSKLAEKKTKDAIAIVNKTVRNLAILESLNTQLNDLTEYEWLGLIGYSNDPSTASHYTLHGFIINWMERNHGRIKMKHMIALLYLNYGTVKTLIHTRKRNAVNKGTISKSITGAIVFSVMKKSANEIGKPKKVVMGNVIEREGDKRGFINFKKDPLLEEFKLKTERATQDKIKELAKKYEEINIEKRNAWEAHKALIQKLPITNGKFLDFVYERIPKGTN